jgi:glycosyltransferase involved in cell wall biosynthesis
MQDLYLLEQNPKISIITPTYNRASMLLEAINSVIDQDYDNWELIVIDNFSTDDTDKILANISDERIRSVKKIKTGSVAASRNLGISMATGEWIAFLDSDDLWDNKKLSTAVSFISRGYELIYHPLRILNEKNPTTKYRTTPRNAQIKTPVYINLLLEGNKIALSSVVVRKMYLEMIGGMNESKELYALEDYDAWLRISKLTEKFLCIPKVLGSYRVHENNISNKNTFTYIARGLESHLVGLSTHQRHRFDALYIYKELVNELKQGKHSHFWRKLFFALRYAPLKYSIRLLLRLPQMIMYSMFSR